MPGKRDRNPFDAVDENTIVKRILKMLREDFPGVWWKIHGGPYQERGIPDIVGCYEGRFFGIEVKRPGKKSKTTRYQQEQLDNIQKFQGISGVVTSIEEVRTLLKG